MGGTGVIDNFLGVFTQYIDSGFGLVQGDVRWLASTLIAIDIALAGLFWAMAPDEDVLARLIRKTLYIGVFAFILGNYNNLAKIIYNSFAGLGVEAGGGTISAAQLLQPGRIAQVGVTAGQPILTAISGLMGFASFFDNFIQIVILMLAWAIVIASFFVMAIQLFVSLIEFKLTTLAGFVLVPFGLFGRTAFLAEKVLGNVVSSGVKILVLAVIIGIGSTIFGQFTSGMATSPTINDALTLILAALSMLGLTIFGPGIANGLIAGGPQLGAGAAVGTGLAAAGLGYAATSLAAGARRGGLRGGARRRKSVPAAPRPPLAARVLPPRAKPRRQPSARSGPRQAPARALQREGRPERESDQHVCFSEFRRIRSTRLGPAHEAQPGREPRRRRRRARHPLRRSSERRRRRRSLRGGLATCSSGRPCAMGERPNRKHPISARAKPGTSASARPASRRRTGASPSSAC